jgi:hypothetical protein
MLGVRAAMASTNKRNSRSAGTRVAGLNNVLVIAIGKPSGALFPQSLWGLTARRHTRDCFYILQIDRINGSPSIE